MARYRLATPHFMTNRLGIAAYREAGYEFDAEEMPSHWQPSPAMVPLDDEARAAHSELIRTAVAENGLHITGFGHVRDLGRRE